MKNKFISQDKDYIIELYKEKRNNLFNTYSEGYQYSCKIVFKNSLGILVKEIITTEIEIYKLIDCIYNFLELGEDMVYYFNTDSNSYTNPVIIIRLESIESNGNIYLRQFFNLYNMNGESLIKIFSFDISDNLIEFIDLLYNFFIIDSNIKNKLLLNPEFILE